MFDIDTPLGRRVSDHARDDLTRLQDAQLADSATACQLLRGLEQLVAKCGLQPTQGHVLTRRMPL
jgi:hypothetical protein